jgi:TolA-binding protein
MSNSLIYDDQSFSFRNLQQMRTSLMTSPLFSSRTLGRFGMSVGLACAVALSAPILLQGLSTPAHAAEEDAKAGKVSPEIGKPLQAAQAALQAKKYSEALNHLKEADAVATKSAFEIGILEQLRLIAAIGAEEPGVAAKSYDALANAGSLAPAQKLQFIQAIASAYFKIKEYAATATWTNRYFQAGGTDLAMHTLLAQAYYVNNDFVNATKATSDTIDAYERAGNQPPEMLYQLLTSCALKQNDKKAYAVALEKLVAAYPKPDYWADLVHQVEAKPGFPDRLSIDVYRLRLAIGALTTAAQYMEFAELAIQAGLPAEAKAIVDKGYQAGVLGTGASAETDRQGRLRDMAKRSTDADQPTLVSAEVEANKKPDGTALVNTGLDFYGYGQYDKAAALIQAGMAKGNVKNPDDAKLHLGIVLLAAGNKAKALEAFKSIKSGDAVNDLARLWIIKITGHAAS